MSEAKFDRLLAACLAAVAILALGHCAEEREASDMSVPLSYCARACKPNAMRSYVDGACRCEVEP